MLRERYDLITELQDELTRFRVQHGIEPRAVMLSPSAFEWLLAIFFEDECVLGASPINMQDWTYDTGIETVRLLIDESLDDYTVVVL